ncbi:TonB-dependent receptor [Fulvivirgaceae bacterium PWU4]|uniref:TonB-dependent receptor n=1 Tax=Chryseosolibacter histidini TaxID=2782349 RepID=A0AAP2GHK6_9BACT|nr:TonB-dependent receptor [Chryseosolibacter histidini]MBT1696126.1 TonB-dependent receptor [Chryseosolibacter histidini]
MKTFHRFNVMILFAILAATSVAQAQTNITLSGKVLDSDNNEPIAGANITIKNTVLGTISDGDGKFTLSSKVQLPLTLVISFLGYKTQEVAVSSAEALDVKLVPGALLGEEVVISASRVEESELKSPVAIEKLDLRAIKETPAPGFYDALENVKGVQMTTSSLTFKVPNTRGFNIPNNFRFVQLADGVDMQAATLGVPLGNAIGPTELDIESVEITPGAASALYGMNAINGMANLTSKSPFLYQGLSVYQKTGVNHVDGIDYDPSLLSETAIRYAKAFNNKFAFKINAGYLQATDWRGDTKTDQNPNSAASTGNPAYAELNVADHPAYDAWNKYGDDSGSNAVTVTGINYNGNTNRSFVVRRTGYWEKDLVPGKVDNFKFDAALHYRLGRNAELSYAYRFGIMDGLFQRGNKIQLDNTTVQNHKVELKGANYLVRSYLSIENTGDSYNLKPLSDNLDLTHRSNNSWRDTFKAALQSEINAGADLAEAMRRARVAADAGRAEPGTPEFQQLKNTIVGINNWDHISAVPTTGTATGGAWLHQKSRTYHTDLQYDLTNKISFVDVLVGADLRIYEIIPDGNNFVDFSRPIAERTTPLDDGSFGNNVHYTKFGVFAQLTKKLFAEKLKLFGSLRVDQNLEFDPKVNPRIAVVYTAAQNHNFRASFQNGFRFPALFEALSFVNNGNIRRVGGLPFINDGLNYLDNSYTLASVNAFNAAVNADVATGMTTNNAAVKNKGVLQATALAPTRPERINSFEVGYKSVLLNSTLVIDFDAYTNEYDGFLGQVEVSVPYALNSAEPLNPSTQLEVGSDEAAVAMVQANRNQQQKRYRVYTNARNKYNNYGSSLGITYNVYKKYTVAGNVNYNAISKNKQPDVFVTGFNTPNWFTNISFGNREVAKNIGFNVVYRWQQSFLWESPLANGKIPAYHTFDAQVTYKVPHLKSTLKVGGSNIFNNRYIQYAAGPTIGGLYYAAITVDGLFN